MNVQYSDSVPNGTYFRTSDAEPTIQGDTVILYDGAGTRRASWGAPGVTSTVLVNEPDFLAVHVGFHHKHGGGQFYRYYRLVDGTIHQVRWASLDNERQKVLDAKKPLWAKVPGSLKPETPVSPTRAGGEHFFKAVAVAGGEFRSIFDGQTVYQLGVPVEDRVPRRGHRGGLYCYVSVDEAKRADIPERSVLADAPRAILRVRAEGAYCKYNGEGQAKYAFRKLTPLERVA